MTSNQNVIRAAKLELLIAESYSSPLFVNEKMECFARAGNLCSGNLDNNEPLPNVL